MVASPFKRNQHTASPAAVAPKLQAANTDLLLIQPWRSDESLCVRFDDIEAVQKEPVDSRISIPRGLGVRIYLSGGQDVLLGTVSFENVIHALEAHYGMNETNLSLFFYNDSVVETYLRVSAVSGWSTLNQGYVIYMRSGRTFRLKFKPQYLENLICADSPVRVKQGESTVNRPAA